MVALKEPSLFWLDKVFLEDVQCLVLNSPSNVIFEGIKENSILIHLLGHIYKGTSLSKISVRKLFVK